MLFRSVANEVVKSMLKKGIQVLDSDILILGFTFKENCPDVRNTKVIDIIKTPKAYNINVTIYDPWANVREVQHEYGITTITNKLPSAKFDAIILAVAHNEFTNNFDMTSLQKSKSVIFDVKGVLSREIITGRL